MPDSTFLSRVSGTRSRPTLTTDTVILIYCVTSPILYSIGYTAIVALSE